MTDVLRKPPGDYVGGEFLPIAGDAVISTNPADPARVVWSGSPVPEHVRSAVDAARVAAPALA